MKVRIFSKYWVSLVMCLLDGLVFVLWDVKCCFLCR